MNIILRAVRSLVQQGPRRTLGVGWAYLADSWFDLRYGTDTLWHVGMERLTESDELRKHGYGYQPTRARAFSRLLVYLQLPPHLGFVDLGCGKGRVLMLAVRFPFNPIRGVELSETLCNKARTNLRKYAQHFPRAAYVEIHCGNAADYPVQADENVFFMFNPFDEAFIEVMVTKMRKSLADHPRALYVIYNNPIHAGALEQAGILPVRRECRVGTSRFAVYSNQELPPEILYKLRSTNA